jgi:hypothetical protein
VEIRINCDAHTNSREHREDGEPLGDTSEKERIKRELVSGETGMTPEGQERALRKARACKRVNPTKRISQLYLD